MLTKKKKAKREGKKEKEERARQDIEMYEEKDRNVNSSCL